LQDICTSGGNLYFQQKQIDNGPIIRMLIGAGSSELLIQDYHCLREYRGSEESLSYLLEQCFPPFNQWSPQDLKSVVSSFARNAWPNSVDLIQKVLKLAKLEEIARARLPDDNLLHFCMDKYRLKSYLRGNLKEKRKQFLNRLKNPSDPWRTLIRELIMAGAYVSTLRDMSGMSPFGELMNCNDHGFADICKALEMWLQDLKDAGVDLEEYGEEEMSLSRSYSARPERAWSFMRDKDGTRVGFTTYGPAVEDWSFYALEPTDRFAGIFWKLVEKQTRFRVRTFGNE
jgi:hypothetical protein